MSVDAAFANKRRVRHGNANDARPTARASDGDFLFQLAAPIDVSETDTFIVELTPPGRGAVAVVLAAGPDAVRSVDRAFLAANRKQLAEQKIGRIVFGRWSPRDFSSTPDDDNDCGEELIVCRRSVDRVEIHSHGGIASVQAVTEFLTATGCKPLRWQEWIALQDTDSVRAAAAAELANAPTERTAAILLDQFHGALQRPMEEARSALARLAADANEESDSETDSSRRRTARQRQEKILDTLLARADLGSHLTRPWRVVVAGQPNVGKSSLANAILGFDRSIVFDRSGTTRDVVTANTAIDGWPVALSDTAGLRTGRDAVESAGVERTAEQLAQADLVLWIEEASEDGAVQADRTAVPAAPGRRVLSIVNKIDLVDGAARLSFGAVDDRIAVSALTGEGMPPLLAAISAALVPDPPPRGAPVPFTPAQFAEIDRLRRQFAGEQSGDDGATTEQ